jgi:PEP-CTERM motif
MKNSTSLIATIALASAALGSPAVYAQDIGTAPQAFKLLDNNGLPGDSSGMSPNRSGDTQVNAGAKSQSGAIDVWTLTADALNTDSCLLQPGSVGGAPMLAPVPEPETYAMMLAGLGLAGWLARRRKQRS